MTLAQTKHTQDRTALVDTAAKGERANPDKGARPTDRGPASRAVGAAAAAHLVGAAQRRALDQRYYPFAVTEAVAAIVDAAADAQGDGHTHNGQDAYGHAKRALALGLLHLQRAKAELADVRTNDTTLGQAIAQVEEALVATCVLDDVRPSQLEIERFRIDAAKAAPPGPPPDEAAEVVVAPAGNTVVGIGRRIPLEAPPRDDASEEGGT